MQILLQCNYCNSLATTASDQFSSSFAIAFSCLSEMSWHLKKYFQYIFFLTLISNYDILGRLWFKVKIKLRGDQEGLFKLVTLDPILNRITGVTSGCWWLVVVNAIPISDICKINQQNISSCSVINNRIKKIS
jgi:MFS-type transporter involved in bile tolerance (Atg22 family)